MTFPIQTSIYYIYYVISQLAMFDYPSVKWTNNILNHLPVDWARATVKPMELLERRRFDTK